VAQGLQSSQEPAVIETGQPHLIGLVDISKAEVKAEQFYFLPSLDMPPLKGFRTGVYVRTRIFPPLLGGAAA
jgi:hypothetical protein